MQASSTRNCRSSTFLSNRNNNYFSSNSISTAYIRHTVIPTCCPLFSPLTLMVSEKSIMYRLQGKVRPPTSSPPPAGWAAPLCLDLLPPPANAADPTLPPSPVHTLTQRMISTGCELTSRCTTKIRAQQKWQTKLWVTTFRPCFSPIDDDVIFKTLEIVSSLYIFLNCSATTFFNIFRLGYWDVWTFLKQSGAIRVCLFM